MLQISKFKPEYEQILDGYCKPDDIRLFCESDIAGDMQGGTTLVAVTDEEIIAVSGYFTITDVKTGSLKNSHKMQRNFVKTDAKIFNVSEIKALKVEELISTERIMGINGDGEKFMIFMSTFAVRTECRLLIKYYERLVENPGRDPEGDEDDFGPGLFCPKCGRRYTNPATKHCAHCAVGLGIFKKLWIFAKKYKTRIIIMLLSYIVISILGVVTPYYSSAFFYDKVLTEGNEFFGKVLLVVLIVAGVDIGRMLINMFGNIITAKIGGHLVYDIRVTIFDSMKKLSLDFFTSRQTGGLMTQINDDASSIYWFFIDGLPYYLVNSVQLVTVAVIMLSLNWKLAAICIAVIPVFLLVVLKMMRKERYYHYKTYSAHRKFNSRLTDSLGAIKVTKAFAREREECSKFETATLNVARQSQVLTVYNNIVPPMVRNIMFLTRLFVWGLGGWLVIRGDMTYGFFTAFIAYADLLNSPLYSLADMMDSFANCETAVQRLFEVYEAEPSVRDTLNPVEKDSIDGDVEFRNVNFSYDRSRKIIDNVSFKVPAGRKLGIVGHSGAGKSTLANLLIRLYDATSGEILIDGVNVRDMSMKLLRDNVSIVSQETYLFSGTIYDNIAYARPDASRQEVIEAARKAGAHEFIVRLPDGYQTKVGRGQKDLSGGEKQRVSIARAILKNPKILILDEATASMDTKTERMIQMSLDDLSVNRTTITIAHRLSTLKNVDNLIVIEDGKLVQSGTHVELMAEEGIYRRLYNLQLAALVNVIEEDNHGRQHHGKSFGPKPGK